MAPTRTLLIILAGGAGGRLELLTESRAKPAVPYAGVYRLVDFPLSNALHSGVHDVWVIEQFNPVSLSDHLANGRPWDLDRTVGGLLVLHPHRGTDKEGWHHGTADALWRHAELIRQFAPEALVVVSADAAYLLDYAEVVAAHRESGAAVTMVTTTVAAPDAGRYGVVQVAPDGRVRDYAYKPDEPAGDLVSNEVFVFDPPTVLDVLDELAADAGEEGLRDLGTALLPRLVADGGAREYRFDRYWRDLGTVDAYWSSHLDLLVDDPPLVLDDPAWPLRTRGHPAGPAWLATGARVADSLVSPGARVAGTVERSVIGPGVRVKTGAVVRDSVLLSGTVVRRGAALHRVVADDRVEVGPEARVGGPDGVALLGRACRIDAGAQVDAGARVPDA